MDQTSLARSADVALLIVYGGVSSFFLFRFARFRRAPSIGVALLPTGWIFHSLVNLGVVEHHPSGAVRWLGVAFGLFLLTTAFRAERMDQDRQQ